MLLCGKCSGQSYTLSPWFAGADAALWYYSNLPFCFSDSTLALRQENDKEAKSINWHNHYNILIKSQVNRVMLMSAKKTLTSDCQMNVLRICAFSSWKKDKLMVSAIMIVLTHHFILEVNVYRLCKIPKKDDCCWNSPPLRCHTARNTN